MNISPGKQAVSISFDREHETETVVLRLNGYAVHVTGYTPTYFTINVFRRDDDIDSTIVYSSRISGSNYENMKDVIGNSTKGNES